MVIEEVKCFWGVGVLGGAAAFKRPDFENKFSKSGLLKVQANEIRLLVKCIALHPPPLPVGIYIIYSL